MIIGVYDGYLFVIDNSMEMTRRVRTFRNPAQWFRNDYGLIIPVELSENIEGWDLSDSISQIGKSFDLNQVANRMGIAIIGENICAIDQIEVTSKLHMSNVKAKQCMYYPTLSRITTTRHQFEFTFASAPLANIVWEPVNDEQLTIDEYVQQTYRRSLASNRFGEYGYIYTMPLSDLPKAFELQKAGKYREAGNMFSRRTTTDITLSEIKLDELPEFNWGNIEFM